MRALTLLALVACGTPAATPSGTTPAAPPAAGADATASAPTAGPDGAPAAAPAAGKREDVDVDGLAKALEAGGVTLLDVRTKQEYDGGHVKGAVLVPSEELTPTHAAIEHLPKDKPVYLICQSGGRSSDAADTLAAAGFWVINVKGGTGGWIASGRQVE